MKNFLKKCISHIIRNMPIYVMTILVFVALCSHLGIPSESIKDTFKAIIKVVSFIAFLFTTVYLFYDVVSTVESKDGLIAQNNIRIVELEEKKNKIIEDIMPNMAKTPYQRKIEKAVLPQWTDKEFDFATSKLDEANNQQTELRGHSIELWKWKIITLITLNGMFISIAKFF